MDDSDEVCLPADTLRILNEFLHEKAERERNEEEMVRTKLGRDADFEEDWQLSQFWYSEATKRRLTGVVQRLQAANPALQCALLSCPSLYRSVKEVCEKVQLFEYDKRFSAHGEDFVFYDFNEGDNPAYLQERWSSFDLIIADPPFLSEECITKISRVIRNLQRPAAKLIFCSGAVVEPWLEQCLALTKCNFRPEHDRNLGNEFVAYANFDLDNFIDD